MFFIIIIDLMVSIKVPCDMPSLVHIYQAWNLLAFQRGQSEMTKID